MAAIAAADISESKRERWGEGEMADGGHAVITSGCGVAFSHHCELVVAGFVCD